MPFPPRLIFLALAFVCFLIATLMDWPRNPATPSYGHSLAWAGGMFIALALASS